MNEAGQEIVIHEILEASRQLLALGDVLHLRDDIEGAALLIADDRNGHQHPDIVAPRVAVPLLDLVAGNLAGEELLPCLGVEIDVVGMRHRPKRRGLQLVPGDAGDPAQRIVDLQPAAVHVDERHADRSIVERALEALAHLPEALLQVQPRLLRTLARDDLSLELGVERSEILVPLFWGGSRSPGISHNAPETVRRGNADIIARVDALSGGSRSNPVVWQMSDGHRPHEERAGTSARETELNVVLSTPKS